MNRALIQIGYHNDNLNYLCGLNIYDFVFFASKICDALRDLVRFVQFKKRENPLKSVAFKPATLLKVVLLNGCFSRFVNDANVTKLSKTSHIVFLGKIRETSNEL